ITAKRSTRRHRAIRMVIDPLSDSSTILKLSFAFEISRFSKVAPVTHFGWTTFWTFAHHLTGMIVFGVASVVFVINYLAALRTVLIKSFPVANTLVCVVLSDLLELAVLIVGLPLTRAVTPVDHALHALLAVL